MIGLVARQAGVPVVLGLLLGILATLVFGRALHGLLYGLKPTDPATLAAISLTLLLVAAAGMAIPAIRASGIDPLEALRDE